MRTEDSNSEMRIVYEKTIRWVTKQSPWKRRLLLEGPPHNFSLEEGVIVEIREWEDGKEKKIAICLECKHKWIPEKPYNKCPNCENTLFQRICEALEREKKKDKK